MTEFKGVSNNGGTYETYEAQVTCTVRYTGTLHEIPSPYGDHGDYPVGYLPQECADVDPPYSCGGHQKAMAAMMEIMSLIITIGSKLRSALRNAKKAASLEQIGKLLDAADKLRDAAAFALVAGIVEGSMNIGAGGLELGGALQGMRALNKTLTGIDWKRFDVDPAYANKMTNKLTNQLEGVTEDLNTIREVNVEPRPHTQIDCQRKISAQESIDRRIISFSQLSNQKMDQISMYYRALAQLCRALGSMGRGTAEHSQKLAEADSQEIQAWANQHEFERDQWADLKKEVDELISCLLNVIKAIYGNESQAVNAILH